MKEAIIGLIGVTIGGLIGIAGQFIISYFDNKRWKKEKNLEHLRIKRSELEVKYDKCAESLFKSLETNLYDPYSVFDAIHLFPKNVQSAYKDISSDKQISLDERRRFIFILIGEMKKSLKEIDKEIMILVEK